MADSNLIIGTSLDGKSVDQTFSQIEKRGQEAGKSIGESISSGISSGGGAGGGGSGFGGILKSFDVKGILGGLGIVIGGLEAAKFAAENFFNVLEGERLQKIDRQFQTLSKNAGIVGSNLQQGLVEASAGLIDDTDLLSLANEAMVELGHSAAKLPQILELSRKAANLYGRNTLDVFKNVEDAIDTGNVKRLRGIGIVIDTNKVLDDYARKLGKSVGTLTETELQTARLNAITEVMSKKFQNVSADAGGFTESLARVKATLNNVFDEANKQSASGTLGKIFKQAADDSNTFLQRALDEPVIKLKLAINDLAEAQAKLKEAQDNEGIFSGPEINLRTKEVDDLKLKIEDLKRVVGGIGLNREIVQQPEVLKPSLTEAQLQFLRQQEQKRNQISADAALTAAQIEYDRNNTRESLQALTDAKVIKATQDFNASVAAIREQNRANGITNQAEINKSIEAETVKHLSNLEKIQAESQQKQLDQSKKFQQSYSNAVVSGISTTFQALGATLVNGQTAWKDWASGILGILGDWAIEVGTLVLANGLALEALKNSLLSLQGGPAIAAGLALISLGGALKALGKSKGSGAAASTATGGGVAATGGGATEATISVKDIQKNAQAPGINITVQGNVMDNRQTGLYIADVIRETTLSSGVKFATT